MAEKNQQLGNTLWAIADKLRGAMNADDFRDYMLSFLFLRYLSDNYETAAKKELGNDYPSVSAAENKSPLSVWYENNPEDVGAFEQQMRRKLHYVIEPKHLWSGIATLVGNIAVQGEQIRRIPHFSLNTFGLPSRDQHLRSQFQEFLGDGQANSFCSPGNEGLFAKQCPTHD